MLRRVRGLVGLVNPAVVVCRFLSQNNPSTLSSHSTPINIVEPFDAVVTTTQNPSTYTSTSSKGVNELNGGGAHSPTVVVDLLQVSVFAAHSGVLYSTVQYCKYSSGVCRFLCAPTNSMRSEFRRTDVVVDGWMDGWRRLEFGIWDLGEFEEFWNFGVLEFWSFGV